MDIMFAPMLFDIIIIQAPWLLVSFDFNVFDWYRDVIFFLQMFGCYANQPADCTLLDDLIGWKGIWIWNVLSSTKVKKRNKYYIISI